MSEEGLVTSDRRPDVRRSITVKWSMETGSLGFGLTEVNSFGYNGDMLG
jgi:hypothetical protein